MEELTALSLFDVIVVNDLSLFWRFVWDGIVMLYSVQPARELQPANHSVVYCHGGESLPGDFDSVHHNDGRFDRLRWLCVYGIRFVYAFENGEEQ